jgi:hypothetical protein
MGEKFTFEDEIGPRVQQVVTFGGLPLLPLDLPDVGTCFEGKTVVFECKRPSTADTVERNCKKARKQLRRRYNTLGQETRGVIALDISRAANPKFEVPLGVDSQKYAERMNVQIRLAISASAENAAFWRPPSSGVRY